MKPNTDGVLARTSHQFRSETAETSCHAGFFVTRPPQAHLQCVEKGELRKARQGMTLPLNGLLLAVFVGWVVSKAKAARYAGIANRTLFSVCRFQVRVIIPAALGGLVIFGLL